MVSRVIGENIELAFLPGAKLGRVKADPGQIEQVIMNLVVNARDAMPDGGRLTIETIERRSRSQLRASSTPRRARPLRDADRHRYRLRHGRRRPRRASSSRSSPPKEAGKGTGLGLATVYGVVKQSGGYIWVYSEVRPRHDIQNLFAARRRDAPKNSQPKNIAAGSGARHRNNSFSWKTKKACANWSANICTARGYTVLEAADGVASSRARRTALAARFSF